MEKYTTGTGQVLQVHEQDLCVGQWCVIHKPMPGPMARMPTHWRADRNLMERICEHGVGHPAREQIAHWNATGQNWKAIHGCDKCCVPTTLEGEFRENGRSSGDDRQLGPGHRSVGGRDALDPGLGPGNGSGT